MTRHNVLGSFEDEGGRAAVTSHEEDGLFLVFFETFVLYTMFTSKR